MSASPKEVESGSDHAPVRKTQLYRHYDAKARLLYVGISLSCFARLAQHRDTSHWFEKIAMVAIEHFDTREEACAAEARAIKAERPLYNRMFNERGLSKSANPYDQERLKHIDEVYDHLVTRYDFRGDPEFYVKINNKYVGKVAGEYGSDAFFESYLSIRKKYDKGLAARVKEYHAKLFPGCECTELPDGGLEIRMARA